MKKIRCKQVEARGCKSDAHIHDAGSVEMQSNGQPQFSGIDEDRLYQRKFKLSLDDLAYMFEMAPRTLAYWLADTRKAAHPYLFFCRADLLADRGWTTALIKKFLGAPYAMFPRNGGDYSAKYLAVEVYNVEARPDWKIAAKRSQARSSIYRARKISDEFSKKNSELYYRCRRALRDQGCPESHLDRRLAIWLKAGDALYWKLCRKLHF